MAVIYMDSVFFLNMLMDYLLFLATARLSGVPLRRRRYFLAAFLGGSYAVACFLPGADILSSTAFKAATGVLLGLVAFGGEERLARLLVLLVAVSCGFAGCVLALGLLSGGGIPSVNGIFYTDVSVRVLLIASTAAYLILTLIFHSSAAHCIKGELLPVKIFIQGKKAELTALYDTGNSLRDPVNGRAVMIVSYGVLDRLFPPEIRQLLTPEGLSAATELIQPLQHMAPWLRPRLIPYNSVGAGKGLLLAIQTDWTEIGGNSYPGLTIAFSPTRMETPALWGEAGRKEGMDDRFFAAAKAFDPSGAAALRRRLL